MADIIVKNPRQASTVYGLNGKTVPRSKNLFYIRFVRTSAGKAGSSWQGNLGFIAKSVDRPGIQPTIEEINQYNKKRQITTGYKTTPVKISLHDTTDSLAMTMWNEYSKWYFGDFSQGDSIGDKNFRYDVTTPGMLDNGNGFGFVLQNSTSTNGQDNPSDLNSQFFFDSIEIYQVFGGYYTQVGLINPKITAFDPDDLDFTSSDMAMINMTVVYEAVIYRNNGQPTLIKTDQTLNSAFNGGEFDGQSIDINSTTLPNAGYNSNPNISTLAPTDPRIRTSSNFPILTQDSGNTLGGGALSVFGNYNFGSLNASSSLGAGNAGDVAFLTSGNPTLTKLLSGGGNASSVEASQAGLEAIGANGNPYAAAYLSSISSASLGSSYLVGASPDASSITSAQAKLDQIYPANGGVSLDSQTLAIANTQRPSYSQIGFNNTSFDPVTGVTTVVDPEAGTVTSFAGDTSLAGDNSNPISVTDGSNTPPAPDQLLTDDSSFDG